MVERTASSGVCCFVLGTPAVRTAGGERVEITADKLRRLLVELVLHRDGWVETETLSEAVWAGERRPQSARGNLQTYVHQLRQWLPPQADGSARLLSRRGGYRLALTERELDTTVFADLIASGQQALRRGDAQDAVEAQRGALALWRGEPFTQVSTRRAETEAARLHELRRVATDSLGEALTAIGDPAEAAVVLRALVTEEPLREASWRRLMAALRADNRPADALAGYEEVRRVLDRELGTSPGPELRALHEQLLAGTAADPGPSPGSTGSSPAPGSGAPASPESLHAAAALAPDSATASGSPAATPPSTASGSPAATGPSATPGPDAATPPPPGPATAAPPGPAAAPHIARRRRVGLIAAAATVVVLALVAVMIVRSGGDSAQPEVTAAAEVGGYPPDVQARRPVPGYPAAAAGPATLLFGVGDNATTAATSRLVRNTDVGMLTTTYDDRSELPQYQAWQRQIVPDIYRSGKAMHLLVKTDKEPGTELLSTRYGPACGHRYELSDQYLDDMRTLARAFAGRADGPPLYVSMYNGLEKLTCSPLGYRADPNIEHYYRALQDSYLKVVKIFHRYAPNARVGLNWDGWEATGDDQATGNGRSMFPHFTRELNASDFVSVNAFEPTGDIRDVQQSVAELHTFNLPIMVSEFEPYNPADPTAENREFDTDLQTLFAPQSMRTLIGQGLFAWNFKTTKLMDRSPQSYEIAADIVARYGRNST